MNDTLTKLKAEKDALISKKWEALAAAIPEEYRGDIVRELKRIYSLYSEDAVKWLASLYDPETGGFYCAESSRDTEGYLPDIEDTYYVFMLAKSSGMSERFEGDWTKALPRDILDKAADWIISLQDEDGYFYHPQWSKEYIERTGYQSRIIRDRGSALTVLSALGREPKYEFVAPSQKKDAEKATPLPEYESTESFRKHLEGFEEELKAMTPEQKNFRFYWYGNHFQGTTGLMNDEMKKMLVEFFDKHQNPDTGMWTDRLCYNSTNGIHKIASVYNSVGAELKHVDKIIDSTLEILKWDVETSPVHCTCDLYNVWSCLPYIYKNIRTCSAGTPEEKEARCEAIKRRVFSGVAEAIRKTYEQMVDYLLPDGSFSYYRTQSVFSMQGCPSAVRGTKEGDVGGYIIATLDMVHHILAGLELEKYQIPIFAEYDRVRFIEELRKRKPVVKTKTDPNLN